MCVKSEVNAVFTSLLYSVLFGPHRLLKGQVLLFVIARNISRLVSTVCPDKAAVGKAKSI